MTTTIETKSNVKVEGNKKSLKDFFGSVLQKFSDSAGDMIITVAVLGASLAFMQFTVHPMLVEMITGFYVAGMIVQLLIRIVHRFDEHYTVDELAQRLMELEYNTNEKLDRIINNQ